MEWVLVIILVVATIFFVWQLALFIRDLIKHIKQKKEKKSNVVDVDKSTKKGE